MLSKRFAGVSAVATVSDFAARGDYYIKAKAQGNGGIAVIGYRIPILTEYLKSLIKCITR